MTKHPLDAVESALVDAGNALYNSEYTLQELDTAIDDALRLVRAEIRVDLDPPDPRD